MEYKYKFDFIELEMTTQKTTQKLELEIEKFGEKFGENQVKIIYYMKNDKLITIPELSEKLNISTRAIEKNIKKLSDLGIIKRIGPAKGGYWEVLD